MIIFIPKKFLETGRKKKRHESLLLGLHCLGRVLRNLYGRNVSFTQTLEDKYALQFPFHPKEGKRALLCHFSLSLSLSTKSRSHLLLHTNEKKDLIVIELRRVPSPDARAYSFPPLPFFLPPLFHSRSHPSSFLPSFLSMETLELL